MFRRLSRDFVGNSTWSSLEQAVHAFAAVNPKAEELKRRTRKFLLEVIALVRTFPKTLDGEIIGRQLVRAAAGVAGNYRSPCPWRPHPGLTPTTRVVRYGRDETLLG